MSIDDDDMDRLDSEEDPLSESEVEDAQGAAESVDGRSMDENAARGHAPGDDPFNDLNPVPENRRASQETHPGYVEAIQKAPLGTETDYIPYEFHAQESTREPWHELWPDDLRTGARVLPARALVFNIPAGMLRIDADLFRDLATWTTNPARTKAMAALLGMLFAGVHKGIPSGKTDVEQSAKKQPDSKNKNGDDKDTDSLKEVDRYVFRQDSVDGVSVIQPMFQVAAEELLDSKHQRVVGLRVWILVYDKEFSHSHLFDRLMRESSMLKNVTAADAQEPYRRDQKHQAEAMRHDKLGVGLDKLDQSFEDKVGFQWKCITDEEQLAFYLKVHGEGGRTFVKNEDQHCYSTYTRNLMRGNKEGTGGLHPLAPEFVFNAKRKEAMAFGLTDESGKPIDVCEEQLDTESYWDAMDYLQLPDLDGSRCTFFICRTMANRRTIFNERLPRPFLGSVTPGDDLVKVFVEMSLRSGYMKVPRRSTLDKEIDNMWFEKTRELRPDDYVALKSFSQGKDERTVQNEARLRASAFTHDMQAQLASEASQLNGVLRDMRGAGKGGEAVIEVQSATTRVREHMNRIHTELLNEWYALHERARADPMSTDITAQQREEEQWFYNTYHAAKRDLVQYTVRLLQNCFKSSRDAQTLPAGYRSMYEGLESGIQKNDGSASIAFSRGAGRQLKDMDRSVWAQTQAWLGQMWQVHCHIDGRDRRLMDEMYLTMFEPYTDQTFMLIMASEKGKGKSVRAERLARVMPEGWCSELAGRSAKAGMNGNMAPSNGRVVICDEMMKDLTSAEATESIEYFKQVLTKRFYTIERTVTSKSSVGTDHTTVKIKTDHHEAYIVCCNRGQCFTEGGADPHDGKVALVNRTVYQGARCETTEPSPDCSFFGHIGTPTGARAVRDFRLFTSLVGFVRLAMMSIEWMRPDLAFAELMFKEGDRILQEEYGMAPPEPRRLAKRSENLVTICVMEAVAKVYLFKQTAMQHEAGRGVKPVGGEPADSLAPRPFEIGDLWDVIRAMHPTREMALWAWSHSLEYSIATSAHGTNLMTALAERCGLGVGLGLFGPLLGIVPRTVAQANDADGSLVTLLTTETEPLVSGAAAGPSTAPLPERVLGGSSEKIARRFQEMRDMRMTRNEFRRLAEGAEVRRGMPIDAIKRVVGDDAAPRFTNALFPTVVESSMYYRPQSLLQWAQGAQVSLHGHGGAAHGSAQIGSVAEGLAPKGSKQDATLDFLEVGDAGSGGDSKRYDFAWLVAKSTNGLVGTTLPAWSQLADELHRTPTCRLYDMHKSGIIDGVYMLASVENKRRVPLTPALFSSAAPSLAWVDDSGNPLPSPGSVKAVVRPFEERGMLRDAHLPAATEPADPGTRFGDRASEVHQSFDRLLARGRLPALQPHLSAQILTQPPLRRNASDGFMVSSVVMFEHACMTMEASLACSSVPGLKNRQELFGNGHRAPSNLSYETSAASVAGDDRAITHLCYSYDCQQIAWTLDIAKRFYNGTRIKRLAKFNEHVLRRAPAYGDPMLQEELPEMTIRYPGYQDPDEPGNELRLLSVVIAAEPPSGHAPKDISKVGGVGLSSIEGLRPAASVLFGHRASDAEVEAYRRTRLGARGTRGVAGDLYDYATWSEHAAQSLMDRGMSPRMVVGKITDKGLKLIMNAEHLLELRYEERANTDPLQWLYPLGCDTYTNELRLRTAHPPSAGAGSSNGAPSAKRRRVSDALDEEDFD